MSETTTMAASPIELTESDSSRRDTTSTSNSNDDSLVSSSSPPLKRPRLDDPLKDATTDEVDYKNLSNEEQIAYFVSLMCSVEPRIESPRLHHDDFVMYAELALSFCKDTTGNGFVLSRIRSVAPFPPREGRSVGGTHLNFFANPRGCEEEYLFYGEVQHSPKDPEVVYCYKFSYGTDDGTDLIKHPPHVDCPNCERNLLGRALDEDEEDDDYDGDGQYY